jgi:nicotinamide riboside transporter PnuC
MVKGFWALWNIINVAMIMLLREAYYYVHALQSSTVIIKSIKDI